MSTTPLGLVLAPAGPLSGAQLHGRSLVAHADAALTGAGVEPLPAGVAWLDVVAAGAVVVVVDARCPLLPAAFVAQALASSRAEQTPVVGVRPVTDTVKPVHDGRVGASLDRDAMAVVASPVVVPAAVVPRLADDPRDGDLAALVEEVRRHAPVTLLEAPPEARRLVDGSDLRLLAAGVSAG